MVRPNTARRSCAGSNATTETALSCTRPAMTTKHIVGRIYLRSIPPNAMVIIKMAPIGQPRNLYSRSQCVAREARMNRPGSQVKMVRLCHHPPAGPIKMDPSTVPDVLASVEIDHPLVQSLQQRQQRHRRRRTGSARINNKRLRILDGLPRFRRNSQRQIRSHVSRLLLLGQRTFCWRISSKP